MNQLATNKIKEKLTPNPVDLFISGQRDCRDGKEPQSQAKEYISGYSFQYQVEAIQSSRGFN
jgi:hypothetical protein